MFKAYGIKFIISVDGLAQKFSLKNTVLNVGNGLALLGITTVLCEFVLMYFIKVLMYFIKVKHNVEAKISKKMFLTACRHILRSILNAYFIMSSDW